MASDSKTRIKPTRSFRDAAGMCWFLINTLLVSTALLVVNAGVGYSLFAAVQGVVPDIGLLNQIKQLFLYVAPVLLLPLEWYLFDAIFDRILRRS